MRNLADSTAGAAGGGTSGNAVSAFTAVAGGIAGGFAGNVLSNIKNILPSKEELPITQKVQLALNGAESGVDQLLYLDPKAEVANAKFRGTHKVAIVFVVGGGSFSEIANLADFSAKHNKTVIYGAADFASPDVFAQELVTLGKLL